MGEACKYLGKGGESMIFGKVRCNTASSSCRSRIRLGLFEEKKRRGGGGGGGNQGKKRGQNRRQNCRRERDPLQSGEEGSDKPWA